MVISREDLYKLYVQENMTMKQIGNQLRVDPTTVMNYMRKYGIRSRSSGYRKYQKPINIFEKLTQESLWALGWMASDGNISKKRYIIKFSGQLEAMEKIRTILKSEHPFQPSKSIGSPNLVFPHKELWNSLMALGITPNKSLTLEYLNIPKDYDSTRHFLRGEFEGDGSVVLTKSKAGVLGLRVTITSGSLEFLKETSKIQVN